jgi:hypothetical protein
MHYGGIEVAIALETFDFTMTGTPVKIPRLSLANPPASQPQPVIAAEG